MSARLGSRVSRPGKYGTRYLFRRHFACAASLRAGEVVGHTSSRWAYDDEEAMDYPDDADDGFVLISVQRLYWPLGENRPHTDLERPSAWGELQAGAPIQCAPLHLQELAAKLAPSL